MTTLEIILTIVVAVLVLAIIGLWIALGAIADMGEGILHALWRSSPPEKKKEKRWRLWSGL